VYFLTLCSYTFAVQDDDADNDNSYVDVHQHPRSGFSCEGKKVGEYYSDLPSNCQLYYVCLPNAQLKLAPTSFACPNTTRFNQATRVCSPADQVYCNIAERYYENVHGNIDSKNQSPNVYLGPEFDKTPWQINKKTSSKQSLIVPLNLGEPEYKVQTERPRPAPRTIPKVETSLPKAESPLSTFSLTFNNPQNPRVVARTANRASTSTSSNSRRGNPIELLSNLNQPSSNRFKPTTNQNSRSRLPVYSNTGRNTILNIQPSTIATTPSTTTTTTTTLAPLITDVNSPKTDSKSDYIYDYVEYDAPASGQPATGGQPSQPVKPSLPALPTLDEIQPNRNTNSVPTSNSNIGSLFNTAISHQPLNNAAQPPRISQPSNRPRNQLPQTGSLNYFGSNNPFSSNPFASNPFHSNNSPNLIRQKRAETEEVESNNKKDTNDEDVFSCHDKLPGIGYSDIASNCTQFHICLPLSKGKYKDYQLFCENGSGFNQFTSNCEPLDKFDCKRSKDFYLYNKQINLDSYLKNRFRISKQLADIKSN